MRLETRHTQRAKIIRETDEEHPEFIRNRRLAERIAEYWSERGFVISTDIVNCGFFAEHRSAVHGVRSDMRNGLPVRRAAA